MAKFDPKGITIYNMAKRATSLSEKFNTADAEGKRLLSGEEATPPNGSRVELLKFRDLGGPSRVVVVVEYRIPADDSSLKK